MGLLGRKKRQAPPRGRPYQTRDGAWVRSLPEKRIADFLSRRDIPYEYEPKVLGLRPDFTLPGCALVIEYWGGAAYHRYEEHMLVKIRRYEQAGFRVISLFPAHLHELEAELERRLRDHGVM